VGIKIIYYHGARHERYRKSGRVLQAGN
jgi:hypothetical protein